MGKYSLKRVCHCLLMLGILHLEWIELDKNGLNTKAKSLNSLKHLTLTDGGLIRFIIGKISVTEISRGWGTVEGLFSDNLCLKFLVLQYQQAWFECQNLVIFKIS